MLITRNRITAAALAVTALSPAAALATGVHSHPILRSSPQMRIIDAHHATLDFASERIARTASGKVDAKITFPGGVRVSGLKPNGTHGYDIRYTATVSSTAAMKDHQKFQVRFRLGDSNTVLRTVTLYEVGQHH
jgi:hypothetical protein